MATYEGIAIEYYPAFDGVSNLAQTCLVAQSLGTGENNAYAGYFYSAGAHAIFANVNGAYGAAVYATNLDDGNTIVAYGSGDGYATIYGQNESEGGIGVYGRCEEDAGIGVYGKTDDGAAVRGISGNCGVVGQGDLAGIEAVATVTYGSGDRGIGMIASDNEQDHSVGLRAESTGAYGVGVLADSTDHKAGRIYGASSLGASGAAYFDGYVFVDGGIWAPDAFTTFVDDVTVDGDVFVSGMTYKYGGGFRIDHPLDPENMYLDHSFVESPEMKNFYDGISTADANGEFEVQMPGYFEVLNREFHYQLTPIGGPAPELHVKQEMKAGRFTVAGATPGQKISWVITGIRQDSWAEANRIIPEHDKPSDKKGTSWREGPRLGDRPVKPKQPATVDVSQTIATKVVNMPPRHAAPPRNK